MGITVSWDNDEKTVILYDFEDGWDWAHFRMAVEQAFEMTGSVEHRVDTISHFRPNATLPANALVHFRRAMTNAPANRGVNVVVTSSVLIRTLIAVFTRAHRVLAERLVAVESLEEARRVLVERRNRPGP